MTVKKTLMADENLFGFSEIEESNTDNALILEEIVRELQEFLCSEVDKADSTDGVFEALMSLPEQVQEEFNKLLGKDTIKKRFLNLCQKYLLYF